MIASRIEAGNMKIGVLALQGGFDLHAERIEALSAEPILIKKPEELNSIDGIILPGGESTTVLRLANDEMRKALQNKAKSGFPILATCAGLIFIAKKVFNPEQESLQILDVDVERNAYGRQVDSFIESQLGWTQEGRQFLKVMNKHGEQNSICEAVFIRAPKIIRVGKNVEVLMNHNDTPILVRQGNILGATFHPELSSQVLVIHQGFMALCAAARQ